MTESKFSTFYETGVLGRWLFVDHDTHQSKVVTDAQLLDWIRAHVGSSVMVAVMERRIKRNA